MFTSDFIGAHGDEGARHANCTKDVIRESDQSFSVPKEYVEFGFEFDIMAGRAWPYSNPFWSVSDEKFKDIDKVGDIYIDGGYVNVLACVVY